MEYTPQEVAKLLANRPHQPHYVEWLLEQCLKRELAAERERWRQPLERVTDALAARLGTHADEWRDVAAAREILGA